MQGSQPQRGHIGRTPAKGEASAPPPDAPAPSLAPAAGTSDRSAQRSGHSSCMALSGPEPSPAAGRRGSAGEEATPEGVSPGGVCAAGRAWGLGSPGGPEGSPEGTPAEGWGAASGLPRAATASAAAEGGEGSAAWGGSEEKGMLSGMVVSRDVRRERAGTFPLLQGADLSGRPLPDRSPPASCSG